MTDAEAEYDDVYDYPRGWDRATFPVLAHVVIDAARWAEFDRLAADQTQITVLGHDLADDDGIVVHVGCASLDAKRRVEQRWKRGG